MPLVKAFPKGTLESIIAQIFKRYRTTETSIMLDKMKDLGFKYSTIAGITVAVSDIEVSETKNDVIAEATKMVEKINKQYNRGLITEEERFEKVISTWDSAKNQVQKELQGKADASLDNPIFMMMHSKARGSISNFTQLAGMRGIMAKPDGTPVEIPIKSNFREGLSVAEFFLSTHGARKGSADTALKTADSGYLTRRLVDVSQNIIVREDDCGTENGVSVKEFVNDKTGEVIEKLYDRIVGRFANKKIINPETKAVICEKLDLITESIAERIVAAGIKEVEIRTCLTCNTVNGVCRKCYGRNLATGNLVEIGEAIGVMAAQAIGEPGTQLTMRTFHNGGVAGGDDITQGLPRIQELFEARIPKGKSTIAEIKGKVTKIDDDHGKFKISVKNELETKEHVSNYGVKLRVSIGDEVEAGDILIIKIGTFADAELPTPAGTVSFKLNFAGQTNAVVMELEASAESESMDESEETEIAEELNNTDITEVKDAIESTEEAVKEYEQVEPIEEENRIELVELISFKVIRNWCIRLFSR